MVSTMLNVERIKELIKNQGYSLLRLSTAMGSDQAALGAMLSKGKCGERSVFRLADALDVEPEDILILPARLTVGQSVWINRMSKRQLIQDLSEVTQESVNKLRDIERDRGTFSVLEAITIAEALGISLDQLLLYQPEHKEANSRD